MLARRRRTGDRKGPQPQSAMFRLQGLMKQEADPMVGFQLNRKEGALLASPFILGVLCWVWSPIYSEQKEPKFYVMFFVSCASGTKTIANIFIP
ncbi:hypothetical protein BMI_I1389 [Brucella microti CCM 4915]|uniref:Uncharacterized protein n=1 Tax=Brucella microti (strain BCCN 7-01 / CAPM 6434 / CCM 4915) TaxID=568815 RepID=C7LCX1_BRUMC|nr:hypothetical protein BMI_I1389 [Brucella microti CCM 4915]